MNLRACRRRGSCFAPRDSRAGILGSCILRSKSGEWPSFLLLPFPTRNNDGPGILLSLIRIGLRRRRRGNYNGWRLRRPRRFSPIPEGIDERVPMTGGFLGKHRNHFLFGECLDVSSIVCSAVLLQERGSSTGERWGRPVQSIASVGHFGTFLSVVFVVFPLFRERGKVRSARSLRLNWSVRALHPSAGGGRGTCIYTPLHPSLGGRGRGDGIGNRLCSSSRRVGGGGSGLFLVRVREQRGESVVGERGGANRAG